MAAAAALEGVHFVGKILSVAAEFARDQIIVMTLLCLKSALSVNFVMMNGKYDFS